MEEQLLLCWLVHLQTWYPKVAAFSSYKYELIFMFVIVVYQVF